ASPARGVAPDPLSPGRPLSLARWERIACEIAAEHGVFVALAQLTGFEGGKGFPGGSLLAGPDGQSIVEAPLFEDAVTVRTIDLDEIVRVRSQVPMLADLEVKLPHLVESLERARLR
ncbi:MAG TPA: nitrilase-related carbon-nitrogen hydrolase, partial [Gemmatimonadales bacterium]|nr:nitrilase-related carbon-nitrogen hydrolase [Gemmatimonadales bacterium]